MIELDYQGCKNFWNLVSSEAILITSKPKRRNLFHLHLAYARAHLTTCNTNSSLKNVSQNHWLEKQPKPQASFSSYSNRECFFFSFFHSPPPVLTLCTPKRTHIKKRYVWTTTVTALFLMFCIMLFTFDVATVLLQYLVLKDSNHIYVYTSMHTVATLKKTFRILIIIKKVVLYNWRNPKVRFMPHLTCTHTHT